MLRLFGDRLLSKDGSECAIASETGLACLEWAYELRQQQLAPRPAQIERGVLEMFRVGRVAMVRHAPKTLIDMSRINEDTRNQTVAGVLYPRHPTTNKVAGVATGMAYCITHSTNIAKQVFQWIKFISSREMGVQMFLGGYAEPGCRSASWKDPRVLENLPFGTQIAETADGAEPERLPWNLRIRECMSAWNTRMRALLLDEIKPDQCAQLVSDDIKEILTASPVPIGHSF